jgi:hypothetical protein
MYLYVKKSKEGEISEITTIQSSPNRDTFLPDLAKTAKLGKDFTN